MNQSVARVTVLAALLVSGLLACSVAPAADSGRDALEAAIIERAWDEGWVVARPPATRTWKKVAIVGSGPAGLAAADQLNHAGHSVTVFEKSDRIGGLLRYGIPEFKMEKSTLNRRLTLMEEEGVLFRTNANVGGNVPVADLQRRFDAIVLAGGACAPRDLQIPGRDLAGIHYAMDYLTLQNRLCEGDSVPEEERISAEGRRVVIIGGGDTGADCLGTAHRQRAASVHQFELLPQPPGARASDNPWPEWPKVYRMDYGQEEAAAKFGADPRIYLTTAKRFLGDEQGRLRGVHVVRARLAALLDERQEQRKLLLRLVLVDLALAEREIHVRARQPGHLLPTDAAARRAPAATDGAEPRAVGEDHVTVVDLHLNQSLVGVPGAAGVKWRTTGGRERPRRRAPRRAQA